MQLPSGITSGSKHVSRAGITLRAVPGLMTSTCKYMEVHNCLQKNSKCKHVSAAGITPRAAAGLMTNSNACTNINSIACTNININTDAYTNTNASNC